MEPERVCLWDTKKRGGRPDTMKLLKETYESWNAEGKLLTGQRELSSGTWRISFGWLTRLSSGFHYVELRRQFRDYARMQGCWHPSIWYTMGFRECFCSLSGLRTELRPRLWYFQWFIVYVHSFIVSFINTRSRIDTSLDGIYLPRTSQNVGPPINGGHIEL